MKLETDYLIYYFFKYNSECLPIIKKLLYVHCYCVIKYISQSSVHPSMFPVTLFSILIYVGTRNYDSNYLNNLLWLVVTQKHRFSQHNFFLIYIMKVVTLIYISFICSLYTYLNRQEKTAIFKP